MKRNRAPERQRLSPLSVALTAGNRGWSWVGYVLLKLPDGFQEPGQHGIGPVHTLAAGFKTAAQPACLSTNTKIVV